MAKKKKAVPQAITLDTIMTVPEPEYTELLLESGVYKGVTIKIRKTLDLNEAFGFVVGVMNSCIGDDEGEYMPEAFVPSLKMHTVSFYTDIELGDDLSKNYKALYNTDLYDRILDHIDHNQYDELVAAAEERLNFEVDLAKSSAAQRVAELIEKMDAVMGESESVLEQIEGSDFKEAVSKLAEFGMVDNGNIVDLFPKK